MVAAPPEMEIRLLGVPALLLGGARVPFRTARAAALLAYLVAQDGRAVSRAAVAEALWPDQRTESALHNLRQTILRLRQSLGDAGGALLADRRDLRLRPGAVWCDVAALREALTQASPEGLRAAVELYRGPFLAGFGDEWALPLRAELSLAFVRNLVEGAARTAAEDPHGALALAERAIAEEPFHEGARARKIATLRAMGEESLALRAFEAYEALLADELGLRPSRLVEEALSGEAAPAPRRPEPRPVELDAVLRTLVASGRPEDALRLAVSTAPYWAETGEHGAGLCWVDEARRACGGAVLDPRLQTETTLAVADLSIRSGDVARGYAEAGTALQNARNDEERVRALLGSAQGALRLRNVGGSRGFALAALRLLRRRDAPSPLTSEAWWIVSCVHLDRGNPTRARAAAVRARTSADGSCRAFARAGLRLAFAHAAMREPDLARRALDESLASIEHDHSPITMDTRANAARLFEDLGDLDRAEAGYVRAIEGLRGCDAPWGLAVVLTYLGDLRTVRGDARSALALHDEARCLRVRLGDRMGEATSRRGLGRAHLLLGDFVAARTELRAAVRLYSELEALPEVASGLIPLARAEAALGSQAVARRLLARAIALLRGTSPAVRATLGPQGRLLLPEAEGLLRELGFRDLGVGEDTGLTP